MSAGSEHLGELRQRMATVGRLYAHARHTGELSPLEDALALAYEVKLALDRAHVLCTDVNVELGRCLRLRYERLGEEKDLSKAISIFREAITGATAEDDPALPGCLNNLGNALADWYRATGDADVLKEAEQAFRSAAKPLEADDPRLPTVLTGLSDALRSRFLAGAPLDVLDRAAEAGDQAARMFEVRDPAYPVLLNNLGNILLDRYERTGDASSLARAEEMLSRATWVTDAGTPDRALVLDTMGALLMLRHRATGDLRFLAEAEQAFGESVAATPPTDLAHGTRLGNLGAARWTRYLISGDPTAEREALQAFGAAAASVPETHEDHIFHAANLAMVLLHWYESVGDPGALDESISLLSGVEGLLSSEAPRLAMYASHLGTALLRRHQHLGREADITAAEAVVRRAVGVTPQGDVLRPMLMEQLANVLRGRYRVDKEPATLEEAERALRTALADMPSGDPRKASCLANLGGVLGTRYRQSADRVVLEEAISVLRQARHLSPGTTSQRLGVLENLGKALRDSLLFDPSQGVLQEAMTVFGEVAAAETAGPRQRARCARARATLAASAGLWQESADSYLLAVSLLPTIASQELAREHKEDGLAEFAGLGSDAAAAALQCGDAAQAVAVLECGRAVLLAQALQLRTELDDLRAAAPGLAGRLQEVSRSLDSPAAPTGPAQLSRDSRARSDQQALGLVGEIAQRQQLKQARDKVLADIRKMPGFGSFLCSPTPAQVISNAGPGPIAMVNISQHRSDALVVSDGDIRLIPLPMATSEAVSREARKFFDAIDATRASAENERRRAEQQLLEVLTWLWYAVGKPVTDNVLAVEGARSSHPLVPRLWWIPTGLLSLLPLHSAGGFDQEAAPSVSDRVISSYLPLIRARQVALGRPGLRAGGRTLVVAMPETPGASNLAGASAEGKAVARLSPGGQRLSGPATRDRLLAALPAHANFHFAGHARGNAANPSASALLLEDGPVTVQEISRLNLADANFAYLSACRTASPGEALIDEVISLASAFQMAGFRHVIATLWPVLDPVARNVALKVWGTPGEKATPEHAAGALHRAACNLRRSYPEHPSMWAPYVHVGP